MCISVRYILDISKVAKNSACKILGVNLVVDLDRLKCLTCCFVACYSVRVF